MATAHELAGLVGLALMVGSALVQSLVYSTTQDLDEATALPVLVAKDEAYASGAEALIEATIDAGSPLLFQDFVAYAAEVYAGESCDDGGCSPIWNRLADEQPSLLLRLPDGDQLEVLPEVYRLKAAPHVQQPTGELVEDHSKRYRGFFRGDAVVIIGQGVSSGEETVFLISDFYVGTRDGYLAALRETRDGFQGFAVALSAFAGAAGVVWLWGWRRRSAV